MLESVISVCMVVIAVGLAVFIFYPPPPPSPLVHQLEETAKFYSFRNQNIYYLTYHNQASQNADALVLLHGFPTSSYDYYKIVPKLRKKFRDVILIDFLGFGFSDKPAGYNYSIELQANIVEELAIFLKLQSFHILSHDYGDTVTQELLARQIGENFNSKLKIKTVCLLNGGIFPETNKPFFIQKALTTPILGNLLSQLMNYRTFSLRMNDLFGPFTKPLEQEIRDMWYLSAKNDGYLRSPSLLTYISQRIEQRERWVGALQNSNIPVLMIYGPSDLVNPPPFAEHFRSEVPNGELKILNESIGHYPQLEAPEEVLDAYFEFFHKHQSLK
ncbi:Mesoderm-specific transcript [Nymphon striatum]|nr:Mesoderm-specific transcript [Nymphon striatum]